MSQTVNYKQNLNPDGDCRLFAISESRVKLACAMLSGAKPTLAARVEDKFICIIPCKKEENEVKSRPKGVMLTVDCRPPKQKL